MLPPFIIEQLREREERARNADREQPRLELPTPSGVVKHPAPDEDDGRGIVEIQIW